MFKTEWFGEIPSNWKVYKIQGIFKNRNVKVSDKDYEPLSVTKTGIYPQLENVAKSNDSENRKLVLTRDFVINSRSDRKQSCGVSPYDGSVSLINTVIFPYKKLVDINYIGFLLDNYGFAEEFYRWGHGIVADLWTTRWQEMANIEIPIPPLPKQKEIHTELKNKSYKIDQLIQNQQQQIEKLNEYKQSLISEVVTKGLNPNVEMKNSGVDWIGHFPIGWDVFRVKDYTKNTTSRNSNSSLGFIALENILSNSYNYVETNNSYNPLEGIFCPQNSVLFGKLRPYLAKSYYCNTEVSCSSEFSVFTFDNTTDAKYFLFLTQSYGFIDTINMSTYGTKMPRANINFMNNMMIPMPTTTERKAIVEKLTNSILKISNLIRLKENKILKIEEYKKSLIYEYVTGKKEV